jgi:hypothetical protein
MDQVSFVVADMNASLPWYRAMFGDFQTRQVMWTPDRVTYRGRPCTASLMVAMGRSGDIEIEVVQVTDGEAPQLEHLQRYGEGLHHVRFPTLDHSRQRAKLEAAGFVTIKWARHESGTLDSYHEAPEELGHSVFELIEFPLDDPRRAALAR